LIKSHSRTSAKEDLKESFGWADSPEIELRKSPSLRPSQPIDSISHLSIPQKST